MAPLRLADLLASVSLLSDLGFPLPPEKSMRSTTMATALARRMGLDEQQVASVYYTGLSSTSAASTGKPTGRSIQSPVYARIEVRGPEFIAAHLTPDAAELGLTVALPETVSVAMASPAGFEPATGRLEGGCSVL
jgi:hypothetical protein